MARAQSEACLDRSVAAERNAMTRASHHRAFLQALGYKLTAHCGPTHLGWIMTQEWLVIKCVIPHHVTKTYAKFGGSNCRRALSQTFPARVRPKMAGISNYLDVHPNWLLIDGTLFKIRKTRENFSRRASPASKKPHRGAHPSPTRCAGVGGSSWISGCL